MAAEGIDEASLADPRWRDAMVTRGEGPTQGFARRLIAAGYNGLLVRSFAAGAGVNERNLVIWRWGHSLSSKLVLIDDEGRLTR